MRDVGIDRRAFLREVGGVAVGVATASLAACDTSTSRSSTGTKSSKTLVVRDIGGLPGKASRKAIYDPFTKETGIQVKVVHIPHAQMLAQIKEGHPPFDLIDIGMNDLLRLKYHGASEELDYDRLKNAKNAGIAESLLTSYGVGKNYWASVMGYRTDAFGRKKPDSWADFWDTKAFPGGRALQSEMDWPELEFALLADGVPLDNLYPLNVDRAFKALDEIKGSVRELWDNGTVPGVLLDRKEVMASTVWNGRLDRQIMDGSPLAYQWNGARRQSNGYGIPKGAANPDAAYRLIDFALRPEVQANYAKIYPSGPVVPAAYTYLPEVTTGNLASTPGHLVTGFDLDIEWWFKNQEAVIKRWHKWAHPLSST